MRDVTYSIGDPRIRVIKVPKCNPNTPLRKRTSLRCIAIVIKLLNLLLTTDGQGATNIQLRNSNFKILAGDSVNLIGVVGKSIHEGADGRGSADSKVGLSADSINSDTGLGEVVSEDCGVGGFGAWPFDAVVVVVEANGEVVVAFDLCGFAEGFFDEGWLGGRVVSLRAGRYVEWGTWLWTYSDDALPDAASTPWVATCSCAVG